MDVWYNFVNPRDPLVLTTHYWYVPNWAVRWDESGKFSSRMFIFAEYIFAFA